MSLYWPLAKIYPIEAFRGLYKGISMQICPGKILSFSKKNLILKLIKLLILNVPPEKLVLYETFYVLDQKIKVKKHIYTFKKV